LLDGFISPRNASLQIEQAGSNRCQPAEYEDDWSEENSCYPVRASYARKISAIGGVGFKPFGLGEDMEI
jgi:hypothetical protein